VSVSCLQCSARGRSTLTSPHSSATLVLPSSVMIFPTVSRNLSSPAPSTDPARVERRRGALPSSSIRGSVPYSPTLCRSIASESRGKQREREKERGTGEECRLDFGSFFRRFRLSLAFCFRVVLGQLRRRETSWEGQKGLRRDGLTTVETVERSKGVSFDRLQQSIAAKECMDVPQRYFKTLWCHCQSLGAAERCVERRRRKSS